MKTLSKYAARVNRVLSDNSPLILTGIGVTGVITTSILTGKAVLKADRILMEAGHSEDWRDRLKLTWKCYIPPFVAGSLSIAAIIGSHRIGSRRAAAVAAAYSLSEKAYAEYKDKVIEKIGENKEREIRDEIAQDRVNKTAPQGMIIATDGTKVMCHDAYSNQYFMSSMEDLRRAQNDINAQILHADYATVSDLYHHIGAEGLQETSISGEMGWNTDKMLEMDFTTVMYQDRTPCISMNFATIPIRDPWRFC